ETLNGPVPKLICDMPSDGASIARRTTAHTIRRRVPGLASTVEGTRSSMKCEASSNSVAACSWLPGGISGQRAWKSLTVANGAVTAVMESPICGTNLKIYSYARGAEPSAVGPDTPCPDLKINLGGISLCPGC